MERCSSSLNYIKKALNTQCFLTKKIEKLLLNTEIYLYQKSNYF